MVLGICVIQEGDIPLQQDVMMELCERKVEGW